MGSENTQNFQNHSRFVPPFHYFVLPVLIVNVISTIVHLVRAGISFQSVFGVILAVAIFMGIGYARGFTLTVQDRVIRLEMRQRLAELLPADLRPRIPEFTRDQLVALRFAGDAELPSLARKVLDDKMNDRKAIKQLIKNWQGDYLRA